VKGTIFSHLLLSFMGMSINFFTVDQQEFVSNILLDLICFLPFKDHIKFFRLIINWSLGGRIVSFQTYFLSQTLLITSSKPDHFSIWIANFRNNPKWIPSYSNHTYYHPNNNVTEGFQVRLYTKSCKFYTICWAC